MPLPRIRRILERAERPIGLNIDTGEGWQPVTENSPVPADFVIPSVFTTEFELARYETLGLAEGTPVLPVCPASFRDFMLFEEHAVAAARGMARRFVPGAHRLSGIYE